MKYMSSNNRNNAGRGVGFCGVLTIVFIVLKLIGVIDWPWIWVLSPIWISFIIAIIVFIIVIIVVYCINGDKKKRK